MSLVGMVVVLALLSAIVPSWPVPGSVSAASTGPTGSAPPGLVGTPTHPLPSAGSAERGAIPRATAAAASSPLGISDVGAGPASAFTTTGFVGDALIRSFVAYNSSLGSDAPDASLQLNAFLVFVRNGTQYAYWVQDVAILNTQSRAIYFEDNIWNASSPSTSVLDRFSLQGNGSITTSTDGAYYADIASGFAGATTTLVYPAPVDLQLNASFDGVGHPVVRFALNDGFGMTVYDTVTFGFASGVDNRSGFEVNSSLLGPGCPRCVGNVEFVAGGPYGGYQTALSGPTSVRFALDRWTGHNYAPVSDARGDGVATAEGMTGGSVALTTLPDGSPAALLTQGTTGGGALWSPATTASVVVSVGTLGTSGVASSNGSTTPFVDGEVDLVLVPGTYNLTFVAGTSSYGIASLALAAGEIVTLEVGAIALVFVPSGLPADVPWSVTVGAVTLRGTGAITFGVANGSYNFTVASLTGYDASPTRGNVTINGTAYFENIAWTVRPTSWTSELVTFLEFRIGPFPFYVLLALLVTLGIVSGVLGRRRRRPPPRRAPPPAPLPWEDEGMFR